MTREIKRTGICRILGLFLIWFLLVSSVSAVGIGMAPTTLEIKDVLRGNEYDRTLTLFNPGDEEVRVTVGTEGRADDWCAFYMNKDDAVPVSELTIPAKGSIPLVVRVTVPDDAANGVYNTTVFAATLLKKPESGSVGAVIRASSALTITVTDIQKLAGTVEYITPTDTEVNYPLQIKILFRNTGNVVAQPFITADFTKDGKVIDRISRTGPEVPLSASEIILVDWDTKERDSGDYKGTVRVLLDGREIEKEDISFELFPVGELTREGRFNNLAYEGELFAGRMLKVVGQFENTGAIATKAKLVGEVYRDDVLVSTLNSEELNVPILSQEQLVSYISLDEVGEYMLVAHVNYEGKMTDEKELTFTVGDEPKAPEQSAPLSYLTPAGAVFIICIYLAVTKKQYLK